MRAILTIIAVSCVSASSALAQQQPCATKENILQAMGRAASGPAAAAQHDFEQAVCEYRNCLAANASNVNACEGLRHIMDASAQAAGHYNGSR